MFAAFVISTIFCTIIYFCFFLGYPFSNPLKKEYLLTIFLPIELIGISLGLIAQNIFRNRFKKLFLIGLFLVYLVCLSYAAVVIIKNKFILLNESETLLSIIKLATTNFLLFGIFIFPVLALGVFLIELWVHPKI